MIELLTSKQIRMLEILDKQITSCKTCTLHENGRAKPYWTPMSTYLALGEAPGATEVEQNEPFVGKAGEILAQIMHEQGFRKEQFLFINTVNCRPMDGNSNGKPTTMQSTACRSWIRKYMRVLDPEKIIAFGQYAIKCIDGSSGSVVSRNATTNYIKHFDGTFINEDCIDVPLVYSVHPAYCIYSGQKGIDLLKKSVKSFYYVDTEDYV